MSVINRSSSTAALAWEFWTVARVRILSALFGVACLNALFYHLMTRIVGDLPAAVQRNFFLVVFFTDVLLIVLVLLSGRDAGPGNGTALDARAFVLPLPTWRLVLLRMVYPVLTAGALWVAVSLVTRAVTPESVTGENWPMLGPALVAATFVAWGIAIFTFPLRPKVLKTIVGFVLFVRLAGWTFESIVDVEPPGKAWIKLTASDGAAFAAILLAAYLTAVVGAAWARRGATLGLADVVGGADALLYRWRRAVRGTFRSPSSAQVWLEWRQKGWILPAIAAALLLAAALLMGRNGHADRVPRALSVLFVFLLFYTPPAVDRRPAALGGLGPVVGGGRRLRLARGRALDPHLRVGGRPGADRPGPRSGSLGPRRGAVGRGAVGTFVESSPLSPAGETLL